MSIKAKPFTSGGGASVPDASESTKGKIKIATTSESNTGTDDLTAMTPAKVKARIDASLVGGVEYKGSYTGQSLVTAEKGDLYVTAGTYSLAAVTVLNGDHIIFNQDASDPVTSSMFDKIDNTDQVASVNGETGAVNIYADNSTLNLSGTGLSISGSGATSTLNVLSASESTAGIIETATNAEATAASANDKALVPSNLSSIGTSQFNNDAGFITSAVNQITTVEQEIVDFSAVSNAIYFIASSLTCTLPSSSLNNGDLLGFTTRGTSTPTLTLSGALHTINNVQTTSTTVETNRRGIVWFSYDTSSSRWAQLNDSTKLSTSTTAGIIETATNAEATAASATDKALVPSNISSLSITHTQVSGLGNVVTLDTGVANGNVIVADSTGLPAIDGSQLTGITATDSTKLAIANNLSDLNNAGTARTNLGLGTASTSASTDFLAVSNNLSDLNNVGTARTNLGLGTVATLDTGVANGNVIVADSTGLPAIDGSQLTGITATDSTKLAIANNLSDLNNVGTARTSLGLVIGTDVLSDVVQDTSPQLGGDLDVNGHDIATTSGNANLGLKPHGTGFTELIGNETSGTDTPGSLRFNCEKNTHGVIIKSPLHDDYASGGDYILTLPTGLPASDKVLQSSSAGVLSWVAQSGGGGGSAPTVTTVTQSSSPYPSSGVLSSADNEQIFIVNPDTTNVVVNLPSAATAGSGFKYQIKNTNSTYNLILTPASGTIDSSSTHTISVENESITLVSDGSNYFII